MSRDMKNSADQGRCYPQRPKAKMDNTLWDLQNSWYPTKAEFNNNIALLLLSPHFPRVLNAKLLLAALLFRSARTGTLATQATWCIEMCSDTVFRVW